MNATVMEILNTPAKMVEIYSNNTKLSTKSRPLRFAPYTFFCNSINIKIITFSIGLKFFLDFGI